MFDFEELFSGHSNKDEFVARDLLLLDLLLDKGLITQDDIKRAYTPERLAKYIEVVQQTRQDNINNLLNTTEED